MRALKSSWPILALGLATIGAYGTAYYSIGVLVPVIGEETGWRAGLLTGAFSLGALGQGVLALMFGRWLDRRGSRAVLGPALAVGGSLLLLSTASQEAWQFMVAWAAGAAVLGGGLFYNVTMPLAAQLYAERKAQALSGLTLLGALASPIFYPLAAWLTDMWGWRAGAQILTLLMIACVAPAALTVRSGSLASLPHVRLDLRSALRRPEIHRAFAMFAAASFGTSAVLLHQVAAMEAAGLTLAVASGLAGLRGAFQIPGRLMMTPLVARVGLRGTIARCYLLAASSTIALLAGGLGAPLVAAIYFTAIGGVSLGLLSPLIGLFQSEVYDSAQMGSLYGAAVIVTSCSAAAGSWCGGLLFDLTGSYAPMLAMSAGFQALAVVLLAWQKHAPERALSGLKEALITASS